MMNGCLPRSASQALLFAILVSLPFHIHAQGLSMIYQTTSTSPCSVVAGEATVLNCPTDFIETHSLPYLL